MDGGALLAQHRIKYLPLESFWVELLWCGMCSYSVDMAIDDCRAFLRRRIFSDWRELLMKYIAVKASCLYNSKSNKGDLYVKKDFTGLSSIGVIPMCWRATKAQDNP